MEWLYHQRNSSTSTSRVPLAPPGSQAQGIVTLHLLPTSHPAESLCFIWEDGVEAPVSSTPFRLGEPWSVVNRGAGARPSPPPQRPYLPLDNRFDILSLQDFPPVGSLFSSPLGPAHPAGRGSHLSSIRGPLVQPDPSPPSRPVGTA